MFTSGHIDLRLMRNKNQRQNISKSNASFTITLLRITPVNNFFFQNNFALSLFCNIFSCATTLFKQI
ncbi:unnamed protein product [Tenebrio molitor]|nr:unnamed protein product [Tenebrio molitor]